MDRDFSQPLDLTDLASIACVSESHFSRSFKATFGEEFENFLVRLNMTKQFISCEQVAGPILALCSGMLDAMSGQVLMVDRGATFFDNLMRLYEERDLLDLEPKKETVR